MKKLLITVVKIQLIASIILVIALNPIWANETTSIQLDKKLQELKVEGEVIREDVKSNKTSFVVKTLEGNLLLIDCFNSGNTILVASK